MIRAIFGGTFDPPHNGHTGLARAVIEMGYAGEVIFVPAFCPPHKPEMPTVSFEHRLEMTHLAVRDEKSFSVSGIEVEMNRKPSYTFDVMEELEKRLGGEEIALLMGTDNLINFKTWHRGSEILRRWRIISYPRPNFTCEKKELLKFWPESETDKIFLSIAAHLPVFDLASSQIRCRISRGMSVDGLMSKTVLEYIQAQKLYKQNKREPNDENNQRI
jgi:nicotinate-nucleotide adenylyltransferase